MAVQVGSKCSIAGCSVEVLDLARRSRPPFTHSNTSCIYGPYTHLSTLPVHLETHSVLINDHSNTTVRRVHRRISHVLSKRWTGRGFDN